MKYKTIKSLFPIREKIKEFFNEDPFNTIKKYGTEADG